MAVLSTVLARDRSSPERRRDPLATVAVVTAVLGLVNTAGGFAALAGHGLADRLAWIALGFDITDRGGLWLATGLLQVASAAIIGRLRRHAPTR